jgi:hypothetical protein
MNLFDIGEELREEAEQARINLDHKIGNELRQLREVLETYEEKWKQQTWSEVSQKPARAFPSMHCGSGATPVQEVHTESCEADPPPDSLDLSIDTSVPRVVGASKLPAHA